MHNPADLPTEPRHWSAYWAVGYITSLPQDFVGNYDGEIAAFWRARFAEAPHGARVLDVCTGNGAVALLAADWSRVKLAAFEVTATDAARLDPLALAARHPRAADLIRSVRFLGSSPLEAISLPDAAFDLVTSQYGIEYCHPEAAAAQVARLLKAGGRFVMLTHESGSDIVTTMQTERDEYTQLEQGGLFQALDDYLSGHITSAVFGSRMEGLEGQLDAAPPSPLLGMALKLIQFFHDKDELELADHRVEIENARDHLVHALARLEDVLRVNRMISEDPNWYRVFERHGLVLRDRGEVLYRGRHRSGHYFCFDKPLPKVA